LSRRRRPIMIEHGNRKRDRKEGRARLIWTDEGKSTLRLRFSEAMVIGNGEKEKKKVLDRKRISGKENVTLYFAGKGITLRGKSIQESVVETQVACGAVSGSRVSGAGSQEGETLEGWGGKGGKPAQSAELSLGKGERGTVLFLN